MNQRIKIYNLATKSDRNKVIFWMVGLILGQMGLIFLILQLVGVFDK